MSFNITRSISGRRVADLIITGLECGELASFRLTDDGAEYEKAWRAADLDPERRELFEHVEIEDRLADEEGNQVLRRKLTDSRLAHGLQVMAEKYPRHFADFVNDNEDAITGDVFLQCVAFGEVIYG